MPGCLRSWRIAWQWGNNPPERPMVPDFNRLRSILLVKPSSLGDIVHTLPAVRRLKQTFPHLQLHWLANPEWQPLLEANTDLASILTFPRGSFGGLAGKWRFLKWLRDFRRQSHFDAVLDFQGLLRSGLIARAANTPFVAGLSDSREGAGFFHNLRVPVSEEMHAVDRYLALVNACGAEDSAVEFPMPVGAAPSGITQATLPRDYVILHPFSRGEGKSLTLVQTQLFCELLAPTAVYVVGRADIPTRLLQLPSSARNLVNGTSLAELCWLLRRCRYAVSVDSGPMHMAAALSPRLLGLHTWSDPRRVGPYPAGCHVWKAGAAHRRAEIDADTAQSQAPVCDADIEGIAAFVWERLGDA